MGHYDDVREAHERVELQDRAKKAGRTVDEQVAYEAHAERMKIGRKLYREQKEKDRHIAYYIKHLDKNNSDGYDE